MLTLSAMIEYVIPPFPGDTVTIVGAVLIPAAGWPLWGVFAAVMAGSTAGAALDWWLGVWLADHDGRDTWIHRWMRRESVEPRIEKLKEQFARHGTIYIVLNRFLPAFRSLFFVSAGLARLPLGKVLLFGALSAALWNAALLGVGYLVGYKLERLADIVSQYSTAVWMILGAFLVIWFVSRLLERYRGEDE